ncbi:hypothetical protein MKX03_001325 [Papaver bracteatum]|nr:hypothetical protein MKX03_001325 [Papaver bracteatum]
MLHRRWLRRKKKGFDAISPLLSSFSPVFVPGSQHGFCKLSSPANHPPSRTGSCIPQLERFSAQKWCRTMGDQSSHHSDVEREFETLASANDNTCLTDVVGVLTSHTNLQQMKRNSGETCFMRELTLENLSGMKLKVTLWGDSTSELTRNLEANGVNPQTVVAVVAGAYVKQYLGKDSLSSTNATKIYFGVNLPEVLHIKERSSHRTPPCEITLPSRVGYYPANRSTADNRKSLSELFKTKWEFGYNVLNKKMCRAKALGISTEKGWYYLGWHNCTAKLVGNTGDHWCDLKVKIEEPVPRYLRRFAVEDSTGSAFFVAMDTEVQKLVQLPALDVVAKGEVQEGLTTVECLRIT